MMIEKLPIGSICHVDWDSTPVRVIGVDNFEVFYECASMDGKKWTFAANPQKKISFYRISLKTFLNRSEIREIIPLSVGEYNLFRPDLPMRLARTEKINWNGDGINTLEDIVSIVTTTETLSGNGDLNVKQIALIPYGSNKALKKSSLIQADNDQYFSTAELIWKAKVLQEAANDKISAGIGLYRLGIESGVPSFYIGEYVDRAGILKATNAAI